jgi:hypothetical protein
VDTFNQILKELKKNPQGIAAAAKVLINPNIPREIAKDVVEAIFERDQQGTVDILLYLKCLSAENSSFPGNVIEILEESIEKDFRFFRTIFRKIFDSNFPVAMEIFFDFQRLSVEKENSPGNAAIILQKLFAEDLIFFIAFIQKKHSLFQLEEIGKILEKLLPDGIQIVFGMLEIFDASLAESLFAKMQTNNIILILNRFYLNKKKNTIVTLLKAFGNCHANEFANVLAEIINRKKWEIIDEIYPKFKIDEILYILLKMISQNHCGTAAKILARMPVATATCFFGSVISNNLCRNQDNGISNDQDNGTDNDLGKFKLIVCTFMEMGINFSMEVAIAMLGIPARNQAIWKILLAGRKDYMSKLLKAMSASRHSTTAAQILFSQFPPEQAVEILATMEPTPAAQILAYAWTNMDVLSILDILRMLPVGKLNAILSQPSLEQYESFIRDDLDQSTLPIFDDLIHPSPT